MTRKGIILAGGTGSRLYPSTISVSKQLMPIYDKPMIYYPLSVLMQAGIREVLIITTPHDRPAFETLLQDGHRWGIHIEYAEQSNPDGLAQALIIAEEFLDNGPSTLILGDNLFFGQSFNAAVNRAMLTIEGATVFGYQVKNPEAYGVIAYDKNMKAISIVEKPEIPASQYAVTGIYFYDNKASQYAKTIKPSNRQELEITALNQIYLEQDRLTVELLDVGTTWLDTGTNKSLLRAAQFVNVYEERQGIRICCPEEIAFRQGWIDRQMLMELAEPLSKSGYGEYLKRVADQRN